MKKTLLICLIGMSAWVGAESVEEKLQGLSQKIQEQLKSYDTDRQVDLDFVMELPQMFADIKLELISNEKPISWQYTGSFIDMSSLYMYAVRSNPQLIGPFIAGELLRVRKQKSDLEGKALFESLEMAASGTIRGLETVASPGSERLVKQITSEIMALKQMYQNS